MYVTPKGFFDGSVNAISWAPHEFGCAVAACSSDGSVAVISSNSNVAGGGWRSEKISNEAHAVGCAPGCRGDRTTRLRVAGAITCARFGREEAPRKEEEEERVAIITNIIIIINNNNNNSGD